MSSNSNTDEIEKKRGNGNILENILTSGRQNLSLADRARFMIMNAAVLVASPILLFFAWRSFAEGNWQTSLADLGIAFMLTITFLFMRFVKFNRFANLLNVSVGIFYFSYLFMSGTAEQSGTLWFISFCLISTFLLGGVLGAVYSLVFWLVNIAYLFSPLCILNYSFSYKLRIALVYLFAFIFAQAFDYVRRNSQKQLEKINEKLAKTTDNLSAEKNQTDAIMDNISEGLFLLNQDLKVEEKYSHALEEILNESKLDQREFLSIFSNRIPEKDWQATKDYLEMFFTHRVNPELLKEINPLSSIDVSCRSETLGTKIKTLEFDFNRVSIGSENLILGTVKDVTARKELEVKLKDEEIRNRQQMENLFQIIHVEPALMEEFLVDTEAELEAINDQLKNNDGDYTFLSHSLYQSVHAIKGNALLLGLNSLAKKAHKIEDSIARELRDNGTMTWDHLLDFTAKLSSIQSDVIEIRSLIEKVKAFQMQAGNQGRERVELLLRTIEKALDKAGREQNRQAKLVLNDFDPDHIPHEHRKVVKDVLVQLIRNSVAHGIEPVEERQSVGKAELGEILLTSSFSKGNLKICYKDDGRGLSPQHIMEKAKVNEQFSHLDFSKMEAGQILALIFKPGFSTSGSVGMGAGRGMGMSLIKSRVEEKGGLLKVRSTPGKSTSFEIHLPVN